LYKLKVQNGMVLAVKSAHGAENIIEDVELTISYAK
jgi:hypothetical protein